MWFIPKDKRVTNLIGYKPILVPKHQIGLKYIWFEQWLFEIKYFQIFNEIQDYERILYSIDS